MLGKTLTTVARAALPLSVVIAGLALGASPATAVLAKCQPGRTDDGKDYQAGWYRSADAEIGGIYADIKVYSPWVQPGSRDTGWSMLQTLDGQNWAQVGWREYAGGTRDDFVQYYVSGWPSAITNSYPAQPVNTYHNYKVLWDNTPGYFTFWIDNKMIEEDQAFFTPNMASNAGEIHTLASQMPGGSQSGYHEDFGDAWMYIFGGWTEINGITKNSDPTYFVSDNTSSTDDQIWDKACTQ